MRVEPWGTRQLTPSEYCLWEQRAEAFLATVIHLGTSLVSPVSTTLVTIYQHFPLGKKHHNKSFLEFIDILYFIITNPELYDKLNQFVYKLIIKLHDQCHLHFRNIVFILKRNIEARINNY